MLGPERMPQVAYQIGRAVREMQKYARAVKAEFGEEYQYIEEQYRTLKGEVEDTRGELRAEQARLNAELRVVDSELADLDSGVKQALTEPAPPGANGASVSPNGVSTPSANGAAGAHDIDESEKAAGPPLIF